MKLFAYFFIIFVNANNAFGLRCYEITQISIDKTTNANNRCKYSENSFCSLCYG